MPHEFDTNEIARLMRESRERTHELIELVIAESDLRRPPAEGFRPILWHLGHVGAFEGYWILQRVKGDPSLSAYYDAVFDPIKTPKEDANNLPPIPEINLYLARVREASLDFLMKARAADSDTMLRRGYVFQLVIEHEYQHQETIACLLQMLDPQSKRKPLLKSEELKAESEISNESFGAMAQVAGGPFEMGSRGYPFAYDNEQPPRVVEVPDFRIDSYPVTNAEFAAFIEAGGYKIRSLWSDDGWEWKESNQIECPLYWTLRESGDSSSLKWRVREMFEEKAMRPNLPVAGVSWHEAQAYARFVGKRLPTEAEWEKAASWDPVAGSKRRFSWGDGTATARLANFNNYHWATTPVGAFPAGQSAYGCFDMTGNVWEWTASEFDAYPGFEAFPYDEYSKLWFDGDHRVLKGGSWMTRLPLLRCSFRNFWRRQFRAAFAGFRCAAD